MKLFLTTDQKTLLFVLKNCKDFCFEVYVVPFIDFPLLSSSAMFGYAGSKMSNRLGIYSRSLFVIELSIARISEYEFVAAKSDSSSNCS